jgi:hypothetical protein
MRVRIEEMCWRIALAVCLYILNRLLGRMDRFLGLDKVDEFVKKLIEVLEAIQRIEKRLEEILQKVS